MTRPTGTESFRERRYERVATARLLLGVPDVRHLHDLFSLYADPAVWADDPLSRHTELAQTAQMIDRWRAAWERDGLGIWVALSREPATAGAFVGVGGCFVRSGVAWNLGYRLRPGYWRRGLAQEVIAEAVRAAATIRAELSVTAYLLEGNDRSRRATERAGLRLVWRGPDAGNPDREAVRLLYADRELPASVLHELVRR
jgi:RimJ/RimL family protein N-acetyltransferase